MKFKKLTVPVDVIYGTYWLGIMDIYKRKFKLNKTEKDDYKCVTIDNN